MRYLDENLFPKFLFEKKRKFHEGKQNRKKNKENQKKENKSLGMDGLCAVWIAQVIVSCC